MKKHYSVIFIITLVIIVSCSKSRDNNILINADRTVIYEVDLKVDPENVNWMKNLDRIPFLEDIINKIKSGKLQPYDPLFTNEPTLLTWDQVQHRLGFSRDTITTQEQESGELNKKVIEHNYSLEEITRMIFIEEWHYDPNSMNFEKKVLGLAPVREFEKEPGEPKVKSIVFVVYFTDKKPPIFKYD
ncbi:MAG: hypothetical protein NTW49_00130 [Bacteroidia bacterium]|nr:hypothetical protein [Bacteroidia bacterium]